MGIGSQRMSSKNTRINRQRHTNDQSDEDLVSIDGQGRQSGSVAAQLASRIPTRKIVRPLTSPIEQKKEESEARNIELENEFQEMRMEKE